MKKLGNAVLLLDIPLNVVGFIIVPLEDQYNVAF